MNGLSCQVAELKAEKYGGYNPSKNTCKSGVRKICEGENYMGKYDIISC
jgi:hypothetical protein